jgi:hypothetical protein
VFISQKKAFFIVTAVKTSTLIYQRNVLASRMVSSGLLRRENLKSSLYNFKIAEYSGIAVVGSDINLNPH